jgi:hypothetical protein
VILGGERGSLCVRIDFALSRSVLAFQLGQLRSNSLTGCFFAILVAVVSPWHVAFVISRAHRATANDRVAASCDAESPPQ